MSSLSLHERHYLLAAYHTDRANQDYAKQRYLEGRSGPIVSDVQAQRWMPFGRRYEVPGQPPTPLHQACEPFYQDAPATWRALVGKNLLELRPFDVQMQVPGVDNGYYEQYHVRLLPTGRRTAEQLLEAQPPLPGNRLRVVEWTWRALTAAWCAGAAGIACADSPYCGEALWNRLARLRPGTIAGRPNSERLVRLHNGTAWLTTAGRLYYLERWEVNQACYLGTFAPNPAEQSELAGRVEGLLRDFDYLHVATPAGEALYADWTAAQQRKLNQQTYRALVAAGCTTAAAVLAGSGRLADSLLAYAADRRTSSVALGELAERYVGENLNGADWSCWQLWRSQRLSGKSAASADSPRQGLPPTTIRHRYMPSNFQITVYWHAAPEPSYLRADLIRQVDNLWKKRTLYWVVDFSLHGPVAEADWHWLRTNLVPTLGRAHAAVSRDGAPALRVAFLHPAGVPAGFTFSAGGTSDQPDVCCAAFTTKDDVQNWLAD